MARLVHAAWVCLWSGGKRVKPMESEPKVRSPGATALSGGRFLEFEEPLARLQRQIEDLEREQRETAVDLSAEIRRQRVRFKATLKRLYTHLTPWETVLVARHPQRPLSCDYLALIFRDFCELHGDRTFHDDRAVVTGFARLGRHRVMFIGHYKGKNTKERLVCNFGCGHPEGYRKALLKMRLAQKYGIPVVCLVDTQGAYPGIGSEERGISHAIATNLMEMSRLRTPIVSVVIGEGGSGGAMGLGVADRVAMFRHAFYSVISPEGCAAILWKSADRRRHAAAALKLTAPDLLGFGIIDDVIAEPIGGAHRDPDAAASALEKYLIDTLDRLKRLTINTLLRRRQERIRRLGDYYEAPSEWSTSRKRGADTAVGRRPGSGTTPRPATTKTSRVARLGAGVAEAEVSSV